MSYAFIYFSCAFRVDILLKQCIMQIMETRKAKRKAKRKAQSTKRLTSAFNPCTMKLLFNNPCQD